MVAATDVPLSCLWMVAEALGLHEGVGEPVTEGDLRELAGILSDEEAETFRTAIGERYQNTKE